MSAYRLAKQPDGLTHLFAGAAYSACRAWFDWSGAQATGPVTCKACAVEGADQVVRCAEAGPLADSHAAALRSVLR